MAKVVRSRRLHVSPERLFGVITDYEAYPKFLPEVCSAKVVLRGKTTQVEFELEVIKKFRYTLEFDSDGKRRVAWRLVSSDFFKKNNGLWKLSDESETSVDVHYELEVSFGFLVPGWVTKKLTETSLPAMFDRFEARAHE